MDEDILLPVVEENQAVYNIKHRAFHFAKEVVKFIGKLKYERIYFSLFDQLIRSVTSIGQTWLREWHVPQKMIF